MKESAERFWARSRYEFAKGLLTADTDDAAGFMFAALDAYRRNVPIFTSDLLLVKCATDLLKARVGPVRAAREAHIPGKENVYPRYYGNAPAQADSRLQHIVSREDYENAANDDERKKMLRRLLGGRFETMPPEQYDPLSDPHVSMSQQTERSLFRLDKHPIEAMSRFRNQHALIPSSNWDGVAHYLYRDGEGAREFDEGLDSHEQNHSSEGYPHHSPNNYHKHTNAINLNSLYQTDYKRWLESWQKSADKKGWEKHKDEDESRAEFLAHKKLEWAGYNPPLFYNQDTGRMTSSQADLIDLMMENPAKNNTRLGDHALDWGLECLQPGERESIAQWDMEGQPRDETAKKYFDDKGLGRWQDWLPYLYRQKLARSSRSQQQARVNSLSPANIVNPADHTGTVPKIVSSADDSEAISRSLDDMQVHENGEFSHMGEPEEGTQSARDHIMIQSNENPMDEQYLTGLQLPEIVDGVKQNARAKEEEGREKHLNSQHIADYVANGWADESVLNQLFNEGAVKLKQQQMRGGKFMRDWAGPLIGGLNNDGTQSFSHMFDGLTGGGGAGLEPNALMYATDDTMPGVFTQPGGMMPEVPGTMPEKDFIEAFDEYAGDDGRVPVPLEVRPEHQSALGVINPYSRNRPETYSMLDLHNQELLSANTDTLTPGYHHQVKQLGDKKGEGWWKRDRRGSHAKDETRHGHPQLLTMAAGLSGAATPLDGGEAGDAFSGYILPLEGIDNNMANIDWWEKQNPHLPRVFRDPTTGVNNREQLLGFLGEAGLTQDIDETRDEDYRQTRATEGQTLSGGLNIYSHGENSRGEVLDYLDELKKLEETPEEYYNMPTFDPRDSVLSHPEGGHSLTDLSSEEASRYLLEHGDFGYKGSIGEGNAKNIANAKGIFRTLRTGKGELQTQGEQPTPTIPLRPGKVEMHSLEEGQGSTQAQLDTRDNKFRLKDGNYAFMSQANPADMSEYILRELEDINNGFANLGSVPLGFQDLLKRHREQHDEINKDYYPQSEEFASHEDMRRKKLLVRDINNNHHAVAQILPKMKELVEKTMPGIFDVEKHEDGLGENWNRSYVNHMALVEMAERYIMNHQTPEANKKLGVESGQIMSHSSLPALTDSDNIRDQDLHDKISEHVQGGNPNMLHLFHDYLQPNSQVFGGSFTPTLPGQPTQEPVDDKSIVRDALKHAVARMQVMRENKKLTPHSDREKTAIMNKYESLTPEQIKQEMLDNPNDVLDSFLERYPVGGKGPAVGSEEYERATDEGKKKMRRALSFGGGTKGDTRVHSTFPSAREEADAMKRVRSSFNNSLRSTQWAPGNYKSARGVGSRAAGRGARKSPLAEMTRMEQRLRPELVEANEKSGQHQREGRQMPLGRANSGTQTIMPMSTSKGLLRGNSHPMRPSFVAEFDHRTGEPIVRSNTGPVRNTLDLRHPPIDLMRQATEKLQPMDASPGQALSDFMEHVDTSETGRSGNYMLPYNMRRGRDATLSNTTRSLMGKGDPLEHLTFLDILKEEEEEREKGDASPIKAAHRIFDLSDLEDLRGFSGEWIVNSWPEGQRVIIERDDDDIKVTGATISDELEESVKEINEKNFVVDAIYDGKALHIVDLLRVATEDVTEEMLKHRMRALRGSFEANEKVKTPQPINTRQTDDEGLADSVKEIEGGRVMLRDSESTYMEGEARHPKWVLLDNEKRVSVIILGQRGQNNPVYRLGIGPITDGAAENLGNRAAKVDGKQYMDIGTATGDGSFDEGDFATVSVGSVSRRERGGESVYALHGAKLQGAAESRATDSIATLGMLTKSGIPHIPHSVAVEGVKVIVSLPTIDDDVIYKARRLENETGVLLDVWRIGKGESLQGDYPVRVAETLRPCWEPLAALMLKGVAKIDYDPREYMHDKKRKKKAEVTPDPRPEDKKPKKIMPSQLLKDPVIVKALLVLEELLAKEKMTWTGPKGLAIGLGTEDSAPRGPTELTRPETLPDFYPDGREKEKTPESGSKSKKNSSVTTEEGEKATLRITDEEAVLELRAD